MARVCGWMSRRCVRHFQDLEDPRSSVNLLHPLDSVVVIAIMAVLAGANGPNGHRQVGQYEGRGVVEGAESSRTAFRRKMSFAAFWPP